MKLRPICDSCGSEVENIRFYPFDGDTLCAETRCCGKRRTIEFPLTNNDEAVRMKTNGEPCRFCKVRYAQSSGPFKGFCDHECRESWHARRGALIVVWVAVCLIALPFAFL